MNFVENGVSDDVVAGDQEVVNKRRNDIRCVRFVFGEEDENYDEVQSNNNSSDDLAGMLDRTQQQQQQQQSQQQQKPQAQQQRHKRYFTSQQRQQKQKQQQYSPTSSTDTGRSASPSPQFHHNSSSSNTLNNTHNNNNNALNRASNIASTNMTMTNGTNLLMTNGYLSKSTYSLASSTETSSVSPQPPLNGWDFSELETRYMGMINSLKDELAFLEESNTNLITELRESQNSNYVLTEEMRRLQRNNINTIDELQACQTANSVLRQELQRLEQSSVKMTRDSEKYKKANSMLKDEIKHLKAHQHNRKNSMVTLKEKAMDLQKDILEKEKDFKDLSSLKHTVNIIVEAVDHDAADVNNMVDSNGYYPTDSDSASNDGNDDKQLGAFTPKPVKKSETFSSSLPSPLARKLFSQGGIASRSPLLRRKNKYNSNSDVTERSRSRSLNTNSNTPTSGGSRDQSPSPPASSAASTPGAAVVRRRGSLDSFQNMTNKDSTTTPTTTPMKDCSSSLRNDTLTRQLGKSLERLHDHRVKRSESGNSVKPLLLRPRSMTFDDRPRAYDDERFLPISTLTNDDYLRSSSDDVSPTHFNSSPEKGTFEL